MVDWLAANLRQRADYDAICRAERAERVAFVAARHAWALRGRSERVVIADEVDAYPAAERDNLAGEGHP